VSTEVGTTCRIRYCVPVDLHPPEPGDFLRTVSRGTCYRIDEVRETPPRPARPGMRCLSLLCVRLGLDAVQLDDPGVFDLVWDRRRRSGG
jgi:hypothetical protein